MTREQERRTSAGPGGDAPGEAYDALVARLEKVVAELEAGNLSLESSIEKFAEGVHLAREASRKLDEAEKRVEVLTRSEEGEPRASPLDPEGAK